MGRILLVVLLVVAGVMVWRLQTDSEVHGRERGGGPTAGGVEDPIGELLAPDAPDQAPERRAEEVGAGGPEHAEITLGAGLDRLAAGGDGAEGLSRRWQELVERTEPAAQLAALASHGSYVHSEEGRGLARRFVAAAEGMAAPERLRVLQSLLEGAMSATIEAGDRGAIEFVETLRAPLHATADRVLGDSGNAARALTVRVASGDNLSAIATRLAREHRIRLEGTTIGHLNGITDPRRLGAGQLLRVPIDPVRTVVHRSSFLLAVYVGDDLWRLWWCAHGKSGQETEPGTYEIVEKVKSPDWYRPGGGVVPFGHPENPLGTHFVKFDRNGYGIHGTWEPDSIRHRSSQGCIRLRNEEVAVYFELIPRGSAVEIR
jgi:nucleoid-associated protein YgaU